MTTRKKEKGQKASKRPGKRGISRPVVDKGSLPEGKRKVLNAYPIRSPSSELKWSRKKDGTSVIKIQKRLTRFEHRLKKVVGGPDHLRLPLDAPGSRIWELCDGEHTIDDIGHIVHEEFKEEIEPVYPRLVKFIEHMLKRNLILLRTAEQQRMKKVVARTKGKKKTRKRRRKDMEKRQKKN